MKVIIRTFKRIGINIMSFIRYNIGHIGTLIIILTPFVCLWAGIHYGALRGNGIYVGYESLIPFAGLILGGILRALANTMGTGTQVPIARTRFTHEDRKTGEVQVDQARLQEMILYVADVEDWIERQGYRDEL